MNQSVIEANLTRALWLAEPGGFLVYHVPEGWITRFGVSGPTRDSPSRDMFCYAPTTTEPHSLVGTQFVPIELLQRMEEITVEEAAMIHPRMVNQVANEAHMWRGPRQMPIPSTNLSPTKWGYAVHAYAIVRVKVMVPAESADCPNAAVSLVSDYLTSRLPELVNDDSPPFDDGDLSVHTIEYAEDIESFLVDTLNDDGDPIAETNFNKHGQLLTGNEPVTGPPQRSRLPPVDSRPTPRADRTRSIVLDQLREEHHE